MLSTANVSIQFGAKPLFEQVSVKFSDGNRYGLIGANGCGKSTAPRQTTPGSVRV
jgi:ATPase subunit of ABC transporter with duplicated ATPase domains